MGYYFSLDSYSKENHEIEAYKSLFCEKFRKEIFKNFKKLKENSLTVLNFGKGIEQIINTKGISDYYMSEPQIEVLAEMVIDDWDFDNRVIRKR